MNKFFIALSFTCLSLSAMEWASHEEAEKEFEASVDQKLTEYLRKDLGINYADQNYGDIKTIFFVARFLALVKERAVLLQGLEIKKAFCKVYRNPNTRLNAEGLLVVNRWVVAEAKRSILAERRSITYIAQGTYNQPWIVRPEFDQRWKEIRASLGIYPKLSVDAPRNNNQIATQKPGAAPKAEQPQVKDPRIYDSSSSVVRDRVPLASGIYHALQVNGHDMHNFWPMGTF